MQSAVSCSSGSARCTIDLKKILTSINAEDDDDAAEKLVSELSGKDVVEVHGWSRGFKELREEAVVEVPPLPFQEAEAPMIIPRNQERGESRGSLSSFQNLVSKVSFFAA